MDANRSLEAEFRQNIGDARRAAERALDLDDMDDIRDEAVLKVTQGLRHHCGACETRTVMDYVEPAYEAYIDWLHDRITELEAR